jgi:leader peptidase (prepilin peptidase) / N-methyltransferase
MYSGVTMSLMLNSLADPVSLGAILFAPVYGSFVGVLIRRLPRDQPAMFGRSSCESCARSLSALDLVPVASFLALRGRCRGCSAPIAPFHLIVELAAVAVALWAAAVEPNGLLVWADCFLGWTLLALAWIDALTMRLPDILTLPLLLVGLLVEALLSPEKLPAHICGAAVGYFAFKVVAIGYRALRGRDGLGGGDAKLLAVAGAWLGWAALPDVVFIAALLGIAGAIISRARGHIIATTTALPFGPFLAIAVWIVRLYGPVIFDLSGGVSVMDRALGFLSP